MASVQGHSVLKCDLHTELTAPLYFSNLLGDEYLEGKREKKGKIMFKVLRVR